MQTEKDIASLFRSLFQSHPWHGVPTWASVQDRVLNTFIEIVPTDGVKYELDKASGHLRLDRPQQFSSLSPTLYGLIPRTFCGASVGARCAERLKLSSVQGDGDPMDVCVLAAHPVVHGNFLARARPIGGLRMLDGEQADDKLIAVLEGDLSFGSVRDVEDLPHGLVERLQHYFLTYKQSPTASQPRVSIGEVYGADEALETLRRSEDDYRSTFGDPEGRLLELVALLGQ